MSMKALKKALELFEESPSSLSKGMKLDAKSTNKVKKKRKKHKSVVGYVVLNADRSTWKMAVNLPLTPSSPMLLAVLLDDANFPGCGPKNRTTTSTAATKRTCKKFREAQPGSFLKGNLYKLHNCSITRQLVSEPINEIIKNNSDSKKPFIHGKKYSAKRKKKKNKAAANKSVFDESDFEKFFQEYFPK